MTDVGLTIAPRSDQQNSDDLIAGPITITITKVQACPGSAEQPIAIHFDGDNNKPYKPCKSMRRVLVQVWGRDGAAYVGRRMTLYRDPTVRFGGVEVGGIRISHMSDIDEPRTMALTATRASRKPFTVKPLGNNTESRATQGSPPSQSHSLGPASGEGARSDPDGGTESSSPTASPPPDAGEGAGALATDGAPAFLFTMTNSRGESRTTTDGAQWRDALLALIEKKPFDQAKRTWEDNKDHVEAARDAGQADFAIKVEAAWVRRERASRDTGRAG